ncbi:MAG: hypothetical protein KME10_16290 [Plectolyngbya sp. WJT66-NPBG17]|nr:hypothetical protein [Plectolyngbya sp. WJT66-NPBG17]MBW4527325.1 hypothetical protein [Phormidium tanganyikae FI6-MK23]
MRSATAQGVEPSSPSAKANPQINEVGKRLIVFLYCGGLFKGGRIQEHGENRKQLGEKAVTEN